MKGRLFTAWLALTMVAVACASPDLVGGDDARGSESVTNDAQSDATSEGDLTTGEGSATDPGAGSDETVTGDQTTEEEPAPDPGDQTVPVLVDGDHGAEDDAHHRRCCSRPRRNGAFFGRQQ